MELRFKKVRSHASLPRYATAASAGCDLCAAIEKPVTIEEGEIVRIPTGLALDTDRDDVVFLLFARSGLATKHGIALANGVGVIDADYRGELSVALINQGKEAYTVSPGDRIAQLTTMPILRPTITETSTLTETTRGEGGFGSTGKN